MNRDSVQMKANVPNTPTLFQNSLVTLPSACCHAIFNFLDTNEVFYQVRWVCTVLRKTVESGFRKLVITPESCQRLSPFLNSLKFTFSHVNALQLLGYGSKDCLPQNFVFFDSIKRLESVRFDNCVLTYHNVDFLFKKVCASCQASPSILHFQTISFLTTPLSISKLGYYFELFFQSLQYLSLCDCGLNLHSLRLLVPYLHQFKHLKILNLSDNALENTGVLLLIPPLRACTTLQRLSLAHVELDDLGGAAFLQQAFFQTLQILDLSGNDLNIETIRALSIFKKRNESLVALNFYDTLIDADLLQNLLSINYQLTNQWQFPCGLSSQTDHIGNDQILPFASLNVSFLDTLKCFEYVSHPISSANPLIICTNQNKMRPNLDLQDHISMDVNAQISPIYQMPPSLSKFINSNASARAEKNEEAILYVNDCTDEDCITDSEEDSDYVVEEPVELDQDGLSESASDQCSSNDSDFELCNANSEKVFEISSHEIESSSETARPFAYESISNETIQSDSDLRASSQSSNQSSSNDSEENASTIHLSQSKAPVGPTDPYFSKRAKRHKKSQTLLDELHDLMSDIQESDRPSSRTRLRSTRNTKNHI